MTGYEIDNHLFDLVNSERITMQAYAVGHYIKKIQNFKNVHVFTVIISSMATTLNISRQSASKYFDELVDVGFIRVVELTSNKGAKVYIDCKVDVKSDVKNINTEIDSKDVDVKGGVKSDVKNFNTLKKEEKRKKNLSTSNSSSSIKEPFQNLKPTDCKEYINEQLEHHIFNLKQATNYTVEQIQNAVDTFVNYQELESKMYHFKSDSFKHFAHWIKRIDLNKINKPKEQKLNANQMTDDEIAKWVVEKRYGKQP
jgi:predicted transcriptional regulator